MPEIDSTANILEARKQEREKARRKLKRILIITVSLIFVSIIAFFIFNRVKRNESVTSLNIFDGGTKFVDNKEADKEYNKPLKLKLPEEKQEALDKNIRSAFVLEAGIQDYEINVKKNTSIAIRNNTGMIIALNFSDGQNLRLLDGEEKSILFLNSGDKTFEDFINQGDAKLKGVIHVFD